MSALTGQRFDLASKDLVDFVPQCHPPSPVRAAATLEQDAAETARATPKPFDVAPLVPKEDLPLAARIRLLSGQWARHCAARFRAGAHSLRD